MGQWNHVMGTFDGKTMRVYINGVADTEEASYVGSPCLASEDITIGRSTHANWAQFDGEMDEITIHGTALTVSEVRRIYDYQVSWYDLTYSIPIVVDTDLPTVDLSMNQAYVQPSAGKQLLVTAVDIGSYVTAVKATLSSSQGTVMTDLVQDGDAWMLCCARSG